MITITDKIMGLDEFEDNNGDRNSISTRKQIRNVKLNEDFWDVLLTTHPGYATVAAYNTDEAGAKAIIEKIDEALNDEVTGHRVSEEEKEFLQDQRQEIIESVIE